MLEVSHEPIGWLKDDAWKNIYDKSVVLEVFHESIEWLKNDASKNIENMLVTLDVSQHSRGSL